MSSVTSPSNSKYISPKQVHIENDENEASRTSNIVVPSGKIPHFTYRNNIV